MTQTKITKVFQTTISAEAIRKLGLRPGMRLNQFVEGNCIVLEPVEDVEQLAGSLGTGKPRLPQEAESRAVKEAIAAAAMKGISQGD
jgi:bifunctional DNA-binding transcriptional regulator/antitoxin component of YhaV-PrlF toxin-antitoxin module